MPPSGGGCREPSPGQKRARSWPFGLPSSRLRPSACALRFLCNVRHRLLPWPTSRSDLKPFGLAAGRCSNSRPRSAPDSGNRPAVTHRPGKARAWPVDNCTARSGLCWASLAGRFFMRELLHRKSGLRRPRAAPLDPQPIRRLTGSGQPQSTDVHSETSDICDRLNWVMDLQGLPPVLLNPRTALCSRRIARDRSNQAYPTNSNGSSGMCICACSSDPRGLWQESATPPRLAPVCLSSDQSQAVRRVFHQAHKAG